MDDKGTPLFPAPAKGSKFTHMKHGWSLRVARSSRNSQRAHVTIAGGPFATSVRTMKLSELYRNYRVAK